MTWAIPRVVQSFAPSRRRTPDAAQRGRSGQLYFERPLSSTANGGSGSLPPVRWTEDLSFDSSEYQIVAWSAL